LELSIDNVYIILTYIILLKDKIGKQEVYILRLREENDLNLTIKELKRKYGIPFVIKLIWRGKVLEEGVRLREFGSDWERDVLDELVTMAPRDGE